MAKTMLASDVNEPEPEEKPLPGIPDDCREVLEKKDPELLAKVDDVAEQVRMFGQTTQKTVDEAKRRIEAMVTQTTPAPKGESVPVHHDTASDTATFTTKDHGTYRVQYRSPPPGPHDVVVQGVPGAAAFKYALESEPALGELWALPAWSRHLKKKHRKELRELLGLQVRGALGGGGHVRLNKLEEKAHKRAKKNRTT